MEEATACAVAGALVAVAAVAAEAAAGRHTSRGTTGTRLGCMTLKRTRRKIEDIFDELGPATVRRMYRMTPDTFWHLHSVLSKDANSKQEEAWQNTQWTDPF